MPTPIKKEQPNMLVHLLCTIDIKRSAIMFISILAITSTFYRDEILNNWGGVDSIGITNDTGIMLQAFTVFLVFIVSDLMIKAGSL
jgi:hypothetical protein